MMDCLFCRIIAGEIPSDKVFEDDMVYAFKDIEPVAPVHYLIVPKVHISGASEINSQNSEYVAHIFEVAAQIAEKEGFSDGYRVITNCGDDARQSVHHLHFHVLAGKKMGWSADSAV